VADTIVPQHTGPKIYLTVDAAPVALAAVRITAPGEEFAHVKIH